MAIAFFNGKWISPEELVIPIDERGHNFGDGVYEVIRVYNGVPFTMREHLVRLEKSAEAIRLKMDYTIEQFEDLIREGLQKSGLQEAAVYLQVTRGIALRLHAFPSGVPSSTAMTIREAKPLPQEYRDNGVKTLLLEDERWKNCFIKSLNLLPNILAKQTAADQGCFEAILVRDGLITEGSSCNVFAIKDGTLYTTPATHKILHGITRAKLLELASKLNIPVREEDFTPDFLLSADEVFLSSTSMEAMPVVQVDNTQIGTGKPGVVTNRLREAYRALYSSAVQ